MNLLRHKIEKAKSFIPKLETLLDIAGNNWHDEKLLADIEDAMVKITDLDETVVAPLVGEALFNLHVSCPPVEIVEKLLDMFPTALNVRNSDGLFPIQFAIQDEQNIKRYCDYMHLFVNKSCKGQLYQIRQGDEKTTLEILVGAFITVEIDNTFIDYRLSKVIKHFCMMNIIVKEDVSKYGLFNLSCKKTCMQRFLVLAVYYREEIKNQTLLIKMLCSNDVFDSNSMRMFLTVSFDFFREESGLIFFGDRFSVNHISFYSNSPLRFPFFEVLQPILHSYRFPLLQKICKRNDCNDLLSIFESRFPYLRNYYDEDGRSYSQALFAYCPLELLFRSPVSPRIRLDHISLEELEIKDPVTGLLPFMTVATHGSVKCIYKVLLKHPTALLNCIKSSAGQKGEPMTLKRKRDNTD